MIWVDLIYNAVLLIALSVVSGFVDLRWKRATRLGALLQGLVFGGASIIGMLRPFVMAPGLIFDGRTILISLGGLFFGPLAAGVAALMTTGLRVVQGGPGATMGVMTILSSAAIGAGFHYAYRQRSGEWPIRDLLVFGFVVHAAMLSMTIFLPAGSSWPVLKQIAWPVLLIYPLATVMIGKILSDQAAQDRLLISLRDERERLAGILTGTHAGTWEWNIPTGELLVNERCAEMLGHSLADLSPMTIDWWNRRMHPEDIEVNRELLDRHFRGEVDYYVAELRVRHKDGHWVWILSRGRVTQRTPDGKPILMMGIYQDVSDRKQAEAETARLEGDLRQAHKMESIGRLAGGVAHDFNNILAVILGHAELALEQVAPGDPIHHDLEEIRKAAQRSADLTRQLLAFARKQTVLPQVLDLNRTIEGMLEMLRRLIGENVKLVFRAKPGLWPVKMDPSQVDQILVNLCANARDSIAGDGRITLATEAATLDADFCAAIPSAVPGNYVVLTVADTGQGMDKETLAHIFEPFFTTKGVGQGVGLGLATIYGIVQQNRGFLQVESTPGAGTEFRIYLPRHAGSVPTSPAVSPAQPVVPGQGTILLVEDDASILNMTRTLIESQGYRVLATDRADEALRLSDAYPGDIDLLVTDVVMPEQNGLDLAQRLAKRRPGLPCLFMSGYTADVIAANGILPEKTNFIRKPFTAQELAAQIRDLLKPAKPA